MLFYAIQRLRRISLTASLIGADGIHSAVRHQMKGEEDTHFANILMWRSLVPAEKLEGLNLEERGNYWIGPGRTLITYWVRSQNLYSILASVPAQEVQKESWAESGDVNSMLQSFEDIDPRARKMLEACETNFVTGMYYRDPIHSWCDGRVTLLGDAAHPMVPFLAQGACQSMEDAWVLTSVLSQSEKQNIPAALMEYEQRRRPRTARVQSGARAMVKLVHEADPERIIARNGRWRGTTRIDPLAETTWGWVWDYDVIKASQEPAGKVQGLTGVQEGKRMERPESQRAFDIWKSAFTAEDIAGGHDGMRAGYDRMLTTYFPPPENCLTEEIELGTTTAVRVSAPGSDTIPSATILHFHGGGYVIGSANGSIEYANRLAELVGGDCISVDYRLAPEHPYPAAIIDALDAYRSLLANGTPAQTIILSGESSGAGLALALAQAVKRAGDPLPAGIIAVCPFANLTLSGETVREFSEVDPAANRDFLTFLAASYFQTHEPTDPMVSPVYGDFTGLPPIFVTASEGEALLSDSLQVIEMARASGVHVTEKIVTDSVHVFPIFPFLPETKEVMNSIGDWCSLQLQNSDISTVPTDQSEE